MEDNQIIDLYFARSEQAIQETDTKYGGYCYSIAYNILTLLAAFLGRITRNISLDRWRKYHAFKRGGGQVEIALGELQECVNGEESAEEKIIRREVLASLNRFLGTLNAVERKVFVCRYWYLDSPLEIAEQFGFSQSKVVSMLHRTRCKLKKQMEKEGY